MGFSNMDPLPLLTKLMILLPLIWDYISSESELSVLFTAKMALGRVYSENTRFLPYLRNRICRIFPYRYSYYYFFMIVYCFLCSISRDVIKVLSGFDCWVIFTILSCIYCQILFTTDWQLLTEVVLPFWKKKTFLDNYINVNALDGL